MYLKLSKENDTIIKIFEKKERDQIEGAWSRIHLFLNFSQRKINTQSKIANKTRELV